ncbi:MAG: FHA domain-containing protein [Myxococcota bacterium]|nr:FHA domain-containing protein [Myxococcota bacterium]
MSATGGAAVVIGRAPECDVRLDEPTVSSRHARLRWERGQILIEDLGSANGTWVGGQRVTSARIGAGDEVVIGGASLPWSDPGLASFLGRGRSDTVHATAMGRLYVCGRCGKRGFLPRSIKRAEIQCGSCGAVLELGGAAAPKKKKKSVVARIANAIVFVSIIALLGAIVLGRERIASALRGAGKEAGLVSIPQGLWEPPVGSLQEAAIRASVRDRIVEAIDPSSPTTRNLSARVASREQGTFHVGQVAAIWAHVRGEWSYVNDPRGNEYFAVASETIDNEMVGDCDDFAILLVSMTEAIGGDARVVMSDGERGGHAYAEVCIPGDPERVVADLRAHYRRQRPRRTIRQVQYRTDATCGVWLNLDWNADVPGGPYGGEDWAVAIYPDGKTETLAPAAP